MSTERAGGVTFKSNPLTLVGPEIKVGDQAPNFNVLANDLSDFSLASDSGKVRLILSVPSLDTGVCDAETRKFNDEAANFPENVVVYTVSCDLPFAQARWCGAANVENVQTLSDHRDLDFGQGYGTLVKELRILSRAVFLVDANNTVQYVEYVPEIAEHPNYEAAVEAVRRIAL